MLVKVLMRAPVATVGPSASLDEVKAAMTREAVPEVPVVDGDGTFLGIVTTRDVALASASTVPELAQWECRPAAHHLRVQDAMTDDRWAVSPDARVEDVARDLAARRRAAAPILDDRRVVGLVTARQVLTSLVRDLPTEGFAGPRRIVVRIGYGDDDGAVLRAAADIVRDRHASLIVVHAVPRWPGIEDESLSNELIVDTERARLRALLPPDVRRAARVVLVRGDGVPTVLDAALRDDADLIIAGAAVAQALTSTAPCAVLAIPPSREDDHADG